MRQYDRIISFLIGLVIFVTVVAYFVPTYRVWQQNKEGEAELARAEQNRQIAIQEAKAKEESAKSLANAEIIRAEGIAKANHKSSVTASRTMMLTSTTSGWKHFVKLTML